MIIRQIAAVLALMCTTSVAISGNVYKCKNEDGSVVFSGIPCSPNAEKVKIQRHNQSFSSGSGLRPGELKAINDIHLKEQQERTRRTNASSTNNAMSYGDRQRLEALQKEKSRILHADGRQKLTARQRSASLNSIDQEIAAIRGAPVVIQENVKQRSRPRNPQILIDPYSGKTMPRTGSGYTDPGTGTFYQDSGGGVVNTRTGEFTPTH